MSMIKTFLSYFLILLYIEIVFHIACFIELNFFQGLLIVFSTIGLSSLFTFITSITKCKKVNFIIFLVITFLIIFLFSAQLVYFKIYESFFSFNAFVFLGAIKDGYDKVLLTIWQNIIYIILFFVPIIIFFIKVPKGFSFFNKYESLALAILLFVSFGYHSLIINNVNKEETYSFYNLFYNINMPILNVKNFGLLSSSVISANRTIFGFEEHQHESEDILTNNITSLSDAAKLEYNSTDINFEKLAKNENNNTIKNLHNYFNNQIATEKNEFSGMFKDKNLIFIMAESFDEIAIHKELTPTLYKLKNEGIIFNNYFSPKYPASTADGEYMLEWGTLPIIGENYSLIDMVYNTNPYILPRIFKNNNYKTYVYHNYFGYYNHRKQYFSTLNFDGYRYCNEGIKMYCDHFHGSDMDMMDQTIDDYLDKDKFFAYYITLSGHGSYDSSNFVANKHINKLNGYSYPANIKYYMAAHIDFDLAMKQLITKLEKANRLDDTIIVISSDHSPYYLTNQQVNILSKMDRDNKFDRNRASLIIYNSELNKKYSIDKYAMNIDVLPTILNLFGFKYDSRLIIGKDIMSNNNDGVVIFPDRSWVNSYGAYDSASGDFWPYTSNVDSKYVSKVTQEVNDKYHVSVTMQYNDYYKYVFK